MMVYKGDVAVTFQRALIFRRITQAQLSGSCRNCWILMFISILGLEPVKQVWAVEQRCPGQQRPGPRESQQRCRSRHHHGENWDRLLEARLADSELGLRRGEAVVEQLVDQLGTREGSELQVALGFLDCLLVPVDGQAVNGPRGIRN